MGMELKAIARIETDFPEKFGIPRQSGLVEELKGTIVFESEYRKAEALKGLEGYNYIWLLWQFEGVERDNWSVTVRPPRLGGNKHMGVFATRSPFRPNPIGLSSVKLERMEWDTDRGPVLHVSGVDLRHNTPIYDIKPYLPYVDCHMDATGGFAHEVKDYELQVVFPEELLARFPAEKQAAIIAVLKQDPRPSYHNDPTRKYGVAFAGHDVRFVVDGEVLTVIEVL
ncbi:MAG: tRNA (N6-threonylcarbamoyladenosine(37)-N6)-methyltransferase TrmO [Lachnospiraceae bacterium]|nr:tRNA (N6-threonylcarbamoyladenosine(37)-N6)-methyltransferase TrmO [Lachnospiraceae bacterium]